MTALVIEERAWGVSEADARELLFPIARLTWQATARERGLAPVSENEPSVVELVGHPPLLMVRTAGVIRDGLNAEPGPQSEDA